MKKTQLTLPVLLALALLTGCMNDVPETPKKVLVEDGWTVHRLGSDSTFPASVPGCIHLDLMNAGIIPDPFFGENEKQVQWVGNQDWVYQTRFRVDSKMYGFRNIDLVFEGLDTYAKVYLNGELLLDADNMFRTWKLDVKSKLHKGHNDLKVVFCSPVALARERAAAQPYALPDERAFIRKAPYMSGWDWGPRLATSGIWKPVYFLAWNDVKFGNWKVVTDSLGTDRAKFRLLVEVNASDSLTLDCKFKASRNERETIPVTLHPGLNTLEFPFIIKDPKLWWTHNLGEPFLYDFSVSLNRGEKMIESLRDRFGIRTVELVTDKDEFGHSFYFRLNGVPVFMKGANYIPQDNFPSRVTWRQYDELVRSARDANMNMLRVWGGGIYPDDAFYELCDQYGILVWQDFMFACTMYPGDSAFVQSVTEEAKDQVVRLRNHPSLALWCGNNEVDEGWHNWGWQKQFGYTPADTARIWQDYMTVFHEVLPEVVKAYDGATAYWPSSPKHGWGRKESLTDGDMHYWGVWWGREPFEIYNDKVGRFMSEYGFQGYPPYPTFEQAIPESERYVGSPSMLNHQKHPFGEEVIREFMLMYFPPPPKDDLAAYTYLSQLTQAYGIRTALEAHRRSMPYCMGTLYWQLNDSWPGISWSGMDYYGRWKALHYYAKRAFQDVMVCGFAEDGKLKVYLVNDLLVEKTGRLDVKVKDFNGNLLMEDTLAVTTDRNAPVVALSKDLDGLLKLEESGALFVEMLFIAGKDTLAENTWYPVLPKELKLNPAKIESKTEVRKREVRIVVQSITLVKDLFLEYPGIEGKFSDNYIDLMPGRSTEIIFYPDDPKKFPEDATLRFTCLNDFVKP